MYNEHLLIFIKMFSKIGTFLILFSILFFVFKYVIYILFPLKKHIILKRYYLDDILSVASSIIIILNFIVLRS